LIRDVSALATREFDLLVVGGGIYGLTIAYDAAQRGLSVGLIERADFGGATSFNHLKTIHGGLRYLQTGDIRRMRESIRERRTFARIAPRLVTPVPFAMPIATSSFERRPKVNPLAMRAAFALDALVGSDRNDGLALSHHLPAGRIVTDDDCRKLFATAVPDVSRAAMWYDYETVYGDRLTLSFALAAANHGAALANYAEAVGLRRDQSTRLSAVQTKDLMSGREFEVRARTIVNATGPWISTFLGQSGVRAAWPLVKAMNLITSRPARSVALVAMSRDGRALVLLPWQGRTLVGTSESREARTADDQQARRAEFLEFLSEVNDTFPALELTPEEVTLVHRGIVPGALDAAGRLSLLGRSRIIDHTRDGANEMVSVVGVKYTTARVVAERAVDLILKKLRRAAVASRTAEVTLPGAALQDTDPADGIGQAIREEMAQTLIDVVVRRTGLGAAGHPGDTVATECATRMQWELGWSEDRKRQELMDLRRFYEVV
jgi:glycerol-3-phosphate dehydrogenase